MQCDMTKECHEQATHIGCKGWIYCKYHAEIRREFGERTRQMRSWELRMIEAGKPLPSYKPSRKPEVL